MICKLEDKDFHIVRPLFPGFENHPVINGVIDGNNPGAIYVDSFNNPSSTLIWARNEIFFLGGNVANEDFNRSLEQYIANTIRMEALLNGEEYLNLEIYPNHEWQGSIGDIFQSVRLNKGERVPFVFRKDKFSIENTPFATGYEVKAIKPETISEDSDHVLRKEILTFWDSLDSFFQKGIGFSVHQGSSVVGSCISVFVSRNEYEIGINTYQTEHRGKGIATSMARAFIQECLARGGTPHWTTEDFRKDSIAIANKVGFEQLATYPVYFLPFKDFVIK